jgi:Cu/Ag efflux protein CusF
MKMGQLFGGLLTAMVVALLAGCEESSHRAYDAPEGIASGISHDMRGTVSAIDRDTGVLTLLGEKGTSKLPFDSVGMGEIQEGDSVTAHLTLTKLETGGERRAYDAPEMVQVPPAALPPAKDTLGRRDVTGSIKHLDRTTGDVTVHAEAASLMLHFPPAALADFKEGDRVSIRTGYTRGS